MSSGPKILIYDIETSPILSYVWGLYDQSPGLDMIHKDWHLMSWAAKWYKDKTMVYRDQRKAKNVEDDKEIVTALWKLLDAADVVVTQNGKHFDDKKMNARFAIHGLPPPSPYKNIDTLLLAKRRFGFTSNKLAYMTEKLCTKYKKLKHKKFPGFELWKECLLGNQQAWDEMGKYNRHDVLALEELYTKLAPWETTINLSPYYSTPGVCPSCGSKSLQKRGFAYTQMHQYQQYRCNGCGAWARGGKSFKEGPKMKRGIYA